MAVMPITLGAIRKLKADKRKTAINARVRTAFKVAIANVRRQPTVKNLTEAYRKLDKAAKAKIIHLNKAARLKSRLANLVAKKK